jgi:hypothetical protein
MTDRCSICGKPLTDFNSRMIGIGPVCRAQHYKQPDLGLIPHAEFSVIRDSPDYIFIKDIGHSYTKTVTNDADYVLQKLNTILGLNHRRVFYIDSMGEQDEIVHSGGCFKYFKPPRGIAL